MGLQQELRKTVNGVGDDVLEELAQSGFRFPLLPSTFMEFATNVSTKGSPDQQLFSDKVQ